MAPGSTAEDVWDDLSRREQLTIAEELGEIVAAINALPQGDLAGVERRFGGRHEFTGYWRARLVEQISQRRIFDHFENGLEIAYRPVVVALPDSYLPPAGEGEHPAHLVEFARQERRIGLHGPVQIARLRGLVGGSLQLVQILG